MAVDSVLTAWTGEPRASPLYSTVADVMLGELADVQKTLGGLESRTALVPGALQDIERRLVQLAGVFELLGWESIRQAMTVQAERVVRLGSAEAAERRGLFEGILAGLLDINVRLGDAGAAAASHPHRADETLAGRLRGSVIAQTRNELDVLATLLDDGPTGRSPADRADLGNRVTCIAGSLSLLDMPRAALMIDRCRRLVDATADAPAAQAPDAIVNQVTGSLATVQRYLRAYIVDPAAADLWLAAVEVPWQDAVSTAPAASADATTGMRAAAAGHAADDRETVFAQAAADLIASAADFAGQWRSGSAAAFPATRLVALLRGLSVAADHAGKDDIHYLSQDVAMVVDAAASGDRELSPQLYETIEHSLSTLAGKLAATKYRH